MTLHCYPGHHQALTLFDHHLEWLWTFELVEVGVGSAQAGYWPTEDGILASGTPLCANLGEWHPLSVSLFPYLSVGCWWPFPLCLVTRWLHRIVDASEPWDLKSIGLMMADVSILRPSNALSAISPLHMLMKQCSADYPQRESTPWLLKLEICNENWAQDTNSATSHSVESQLSA